MCGGTLLLRVSFAAVVKKWKKKKKKRKKKEHRHALKDSRHLPSSLSSLFSFSSLSLFSLFSLFLWSLRCTFLAAQRSLHLLRVVCLRRKKNEAYAHTKRNIKSARQEDLFVKAMKRGRGALEDAENNDDEEEHFLAGTAEGEQEQEQEENERSHRASRTKTTTTTERFAAIKGLLRV